MYCSVGVVGLMAAKLVGALNSLDELTVGQTWLWVVYAGGVAGDVCVVVCVDVCGSGVVRAGSVVCVAVCVYMYHEFQQVIYLS